MSQQEQQALTTAAMRAQTEMHANAPNVDTYIGVDVAKAPPRFYCIDRIVIGMVDCGYSRLLRTFGLDQHHCRKRKMMP